MTSSPSFRDTIKATFGNRIRVRVSGVLVENDEILLLKHVGIGAKNEWWAPPGGGLKFGETIEEALKREFEEESNIKIKMGRFLFINEYLQSPFHAIELFFWVFREEGTPKLGKDTEMKEGEQILNELKMIPLKSLKKMDPDVIHNAFRNISRVEDFNLSPQHIIHQV